MKHMKKRGGESGEGSFGHLRSQGKSTTFRRKDEENSERERSPDLSLFRRVNDSQKGRQGLEGRGRKKGRIKPIRREFPMSGSIPKDKVERFGRNKGSRHLESVF